MNTDYPSDSITLYHYTTTQGYEAIMKSQMIQMSTDGRQDAAFGEGVYLKSLPPNGSYTQVQIAQNNYNGAYQYNIEKTKFCLGFAIPAGEVKDYSKSGRDAWLLEAKDLYFKEYLPFWVGEYVEEQDAYKVFDINWCGLYIIH